MTIHSNTPPVHSGICAKRTNLAELARACRRAGCCKRWGVHSGLSQAAESAGAACDGADGSTSSGARTNSTKPTPSLILLRANHMGFSTYTTRFSRFDAELDVGPS